MRDRPWNIVYQCVHVRKEEGKGGVERKGKRDGERARRGCGGARKEALDIGRRERKRKRENG